MTEEDVVCITGYRFEQDLFWIDIELKKYGIIIYGISIDCKDGLFKINFPTHYDERFNKNILTVSFTNQEYLNYIENEIIKEIKSNKWIMSYLEE